MNADVQHDLENPPEGLAVRVHQRLTIVLEVVVNADVQHDLENPPEGLLYVVSRD